MKLFGPKTNRREPPTGPVERSKEGASEAPPVELIHPFYLDTDMSMAFAAAISGGVALESEDLKRNTHESDAVRRFEGNLRMFDLLGAGGELGNKSSDAVGTESRFVRQHTKASIFISLYDELKRTNQIDEIDMESLDAGDMVSVTLGPAVAPLRRVVDQIIRLLEVAAPMLGVDLPALDEVEDGSYESRQQRRKQQREAAKKLATSGGPPELRQMYTLFAAIQQDLEQSGMIDVVVYREGKPTVVLTLDKRFVNDQVLELLHTSKFTVIGKVTEIWPTEDDVVNLYRRSVMSLVPALTQMAAWGMISLIASFAGAIDVKQMQASAYAAARVSNNPSETASEESSTADGPEAAEEENGEMDEVQLGDLSALSPAVTGPALQILPLAICA